MRFLKYTPQELADAVRTSFSKAQALEKVGLVGAGGNYATFNKAVKFLGLDTSHFTGQRHNAGKKLEWRIRELDDYLSNKIPIQSHKLKLRLLREKVFEHRCHCCGLADWNDLPIALELHHLDGDRNNNLLENLRLYCPNCHAQTDNYRGKNKGAYHA